MFYGTTPEVVGKDSKRHSEFTVVASYIHPAKHRRLSETFYINFKEYLGTWPEYSDIEDLSKKLEKALSELTTEFKSLNRRLDCLDSLTGPTGLNISYTTLRNILHILNRDGQFEKVDPRRRDGSLFQEVLGVDFSLAWKIADHFWDNGSIKGLEKIDGINGDLIEKIKASFLVE